MNNKVSGRRQQYLDSLDGKPYEVGDWVQVLNASIGEKYEKDKPTPVQIKAFDGDNVLVDQYRRKYKVAKDQILGYAKPWMGYNPIDRGLWDSTRTVAFATESILFQTRELNPEDDERYEIEGCVLKAWNWNPYVYVNGKKKYYQRDFVWTLEQKQMLIESIYQGIDCGKILVRKRSYTELEQMHAKGERELYFNDIVDGKQRIHTLIEFIKDEFPDVNGMYYSDLATTAQNEITNNQFFSYAEMPEFSKDEMVLKQLLRLNFTGVPQSKEHIEYVKSLLK